MNNIENDISKYQKKKKSSTSKSKTKSKHKHGYIDCLVIEENKHELLPYKGSYCKICGKIDSAKLETILEDECYRMLTSDEVYEKYQNLEKIYIDGIFK